MRFLMSFYSLVALLTAFVGVLPACSARDAGRQMLAASSVEILVFEARGCIYCRLLRRDVLPKYRRSKRARVVPIRFIDVGKVDVSSLKLSSPLKIAPTIVIMQDGREKGRITGYIGPEPFFHMIARIMRTVN